MANSITVTFNQPTPPKYRISYKLPDGSHDSSQTLEADELIVLLCKAMLYYEGQTDKHPMPTSSFEVEKRTLIAKV